MELLGLIVWYLGICYAIIICLLHVFDWPESEVDDLLFSWIMFLALPFVFLFVATRFFLGKIIGKIKRQEKRPLEFSHSKDNVQILASVDDGTLNLDSSNIGTEGVIVVSQIHPESIKFHKQTKDNNKIISMSDYRKNKMRKKSP